MTEAFFVQNSYFSNIPKLVTKLLRVNIPIFGKPVVPLKKKPNNKNYTSPRFSCVVNKALLKLTYNMEKQQVPPKFLCRCHY